MLVEAKGRKEYYSFFDKYLIKNKDFEFKERMMHPALNEINAMISYLNAVFYGVCRSLIFQTGLEPSIGFLHSTSNRKSSLEYDISEVYKPLLIDRTIFRIVNLGMINKNMFTFTEDSEVKINEDGKRILLFEFESRLNNHLTYQNKVFSYRELILNDLYRLKRYILGESRNLKFYQSRF
jgi:CRISPR-associated protein Cas1